MKTNVFNVELIEKQIKENQEREDILAMRFHLWMLENDTEENAERFFHYQLTDMLNEFKKEKGL